jgi:hypothetical protein
LRPGEGCAGLDCMWQSFHQCTADEWTANERYYADAMGPVLGERPAHAGGPAPARACWRVGLERNGLVDGPFAKRPRPGNQSTLPASRVAAPFSSPLHLSHPHPPKPPRLQALLVATLAAEPSAVSNGRADLTVHLQQAHARAPLHASGITALQRPASPLPGDCPVRRS